MLSEKGNIFYKDDYDVQYRVEWDTVGGIIDITTYTMQPFVWNRPPKGYIKNGVLYREGVITVQRQAIKAVQDGYEIIADGISQFTDYIQMNFPCEKGPIDNFKYHFNSVISEEIQFTITSGPHWVDIDDIGDGYTEWCDLNNDGSPIGIVTDDISALEWTDVWTN